MPAWSLARSESRSLARLAKIPCAATGLDVGSRDRRCPSRRPGQAEVFGGVGGVERRYRERPRPAAAVGQDDAVAAGGERRDHFAACVPPAVSAWLIRSITSWTVAAPSMSTANVVPSLPRDLEVAAGRRCGRPAAVEVGQGGAAGQAADAQVGGGGAAVLADRHLRPLGGVDDVDARAGGVDRRQHLHAATVDRVEQVLDRGRRPQRRRGEGDRRRGRAVLDDQPVGGVDPLPAAQVRELRERRDPRLQPRPRDSRAGPAPVARAMPRSAAVVPPGTSVTVMLSPPAPASRSPPPAPIEAVMPPTPAALMAATTSPTVSAFDRSTVFVVAPLPTTIDPSCTPLPPAPPQVGESRLRRRQRRQVHGPLHARRRRAEHGRPVHHERQVRILVHAVVQHVDDPTNFTPPVHRDERRVGRAVAGEQVGAVELLVPDAQRLAVQPVHYEPPPPAAGRTSRPSRRWPTRSSAPAGAGRPGRRGSSRPRRVAYSPGRCWPSTPCAARASSAAA